MRRMNQSLMLRLSAVMVLIIIQNDLAAYASECDMKILLPESTHSKIVSSAFVMTRPESTENMSNPTTLSETITKQTLISMRSDEFSSILAGWMGLTGSHTYGSFSSQLQETIRWGLCDRPRALLLIHLDGISQDSLAKESRLASFIKNSDVKVDFQSDSHKRPAADRTAQFLRESSSGLHFSELLSRVSPKSMTFGMNPQKPSSVSAFGTFIHRDKKAANSKAADMKSLISRNFASTRLSKVLESMGLKIAAKNGHIHLSNNHMPSMNAEFTFDLQNDVNNALLAELEHSLETLEQLEDEKTGHFATDSSPDIFVFHISSLQKLSEEHSSNQGALQFAYTAVDSVVYRAVSTISNIYNHDLISVIHVSESDEVGNISGFNLDVLRTFIGKGLEPQYNFESNFPCVNFRSDINTQQKARLCKRIQKSNLPDDIQIDCPVYVENKPIYTKSLEAIKSARNQTKPESEDIVMYQITLWTGVALFLGSVVVLSSMLFMPLRYDSLLYFSPASRNRMD